MIIVIMILSIGIINIMNGEIDEIHRKLCLKIKMERTKRNWSQIQLADFAQINKNSVGSIERNDNSPTAYMLIKIARAFGISLSELTDISKITL